MHIENLKIASQLVEEESSLKQLVAGALNKKEQDERSDSESEPEEAPGDNWDVKDNASNKSSSSFKSSHLSEESKEEI